MRISTSQLEVLILDLLEQMKLGAKLSFSSKLSGQYHLDLPDRRSMKVPRKVARTAWERGFITADEHKKGRTHYILTTEGRVHCWRDGDQASRPNAADAPRGSTRLSQLGRTTL